MFDENLYQETISALHASEDTLSEVMNMTHKTKKRPPAHDGGACGGHRDPVLHGGSCSGAWTGSAVGGVLWSNGEQEELLSTAAVPMNIVKRDSGAVMRIEQVIADRYCAAVLIDFTAPEGQFWIRTTTHSIGACPQRPGTE